MRTTVTFDEKLVKEAKEITGKKRMSDLANEGLRALIRSERARRLAALGGSDPNAAAPPRRQFEA